MSNTAGTEHIPDDNFVSRWVFSPWMGPDLQNLIHHQVFQFKTRFNHCESLVWRKYATIDGTHAFGCQEEWKRQKANKEVRYIGAITAQVIAIRNHRNPNGHGFLVRHEPREGIHHAHICYDIAPNKELTRNDKSDLKIALTRGIFTEKSEHHCRWSEFRAWLGKTLFYLERLKTQVLGIGS